MPPNSGVMAVMTTTLKSWVGQPTESVVASPLFKGFDGFEAKPRLVLKTSLNGRSLFASETLLSMPPIDILDGGVMTH